MQTFLTFALLCGMWITGWGITTNQLPATRSFSRTVTQKNTPLGAEIAISNFDFTPKTVTIKAGGSVIWINKEGMHTVIADNKSFKSGNLTAGKTFSYTFAKPGTYRYYCSFHGEAGGHDMAGVVKVVK